MKNIKKLVIIFLVVFAFLQFNPLKIYNNPKTQEQTYASSPQTFSADSESYVLGSLVEARQFQFTAGLGRLARLHYPEAEDWFYNVQMTFKVFKEDLKYEGEYERYYSQLGGQGLLFRLMDVTLGDTNGVVKLQIMQTFNLLMLSLVITLISYYLLKRFNLWVMISFLIGTLVNQWIPLSSVNLYWVTWTMFLPMAISATYCLKENSTTKRKIIYMILLCLSILYRCSCGFEFISTILVAMMVPFIEYEVTHFKSLRKTFFNLLMPTISGIMGFFSCVVLQITRYMMEGWDFPSALKFFYTIIVKRTHGDLNKLGVHNEQLDMNLREPLGEVILKYFNASAFNIPVGTGFIEIKYWTIILIIVIFVIISIILFKKKKDRKILALQAMTFVSFLAPMSWYIIAKGHASAHLHLDPLLWHLPFIGIGLGLTGYSISLMFQLLKKNM